MCHAVGSINHNIGENTAFSTEIRRSIQSAYVIRKKNVEESFGLLTGEAFIIRHLQRAALKGVLNGVII